MKSSVPRITLSLNQHLWEKESTDIYERIYQEYIHSIGCPTSGTVVHKFEELRPAIKTLHMRRYFDSEGEIGNHTCHAMANVENRQEVYAEMSRYQKAIIEAEGRKLYGNEIFFHESCNTQPLFLSILPLISLHARRNPQLSHKRQKGMHFDVHTLFVSNPCMATAIILIS